MTEQLTLCIPTVLKYDLCDKLITTANAGIIKPNAFKVLDNGNSYASWHSKHPLSTNVEITSPSGNIGVAAAWNYFLETTEGLLIIANDDIEVFPDTIQTMVNTYNRNTDKTVILYSLGGISAFSFFLIHSDIREKVGYFDETFYPAYFEDNDYMRRIELSGYKQKIVTGVKYIHHDGGSATLKEQKRRGIAKDHDRNFNENKKYYIKKWGGVPNKEKFVTPFHPTVPYLRWWCPEIHNFGDDVGPYLFKKITGKSPIPVSINSQNEGKLHYCTVGSILQECNTNSVIWGSGWQLPSSRPRGGLNTIYAVRGPLTRQQLVRQGYSVPEVYGDPTLLLPRFYIPKPKERSGIGIIPHYADKEDPHLRMFKEHPHVKVINIQGGIETVIEQVTSCSLILSSSLHGIVVADAYGIPGYWYKLSDNIVGGAYKFKDYFLSVGREFIMLDANDFQTVHAVAQTIRKYSYSISIDLDRLMNSCPFK